MQLALNGPAQPITHNSTVLSRHVTWTQACACWGLQDQKHVVIGLQIKMVHTPVQVRLPAETDVQVCEGGTARGSQLAQCGVGYLGRTVHSQVLHCAACSNRHQTGVADTRQAAYRQQLRVWVCDAVCVCGGGSVHTISDCFYTSDCNCLIVVLTLQSLSIPYSMPPNRAFTNRTLRLGQLAANACSDLSVICSRKGAVQ